MKKVLGAIILSLLWCNVSIAESLKDQFEKQDTDLISDLDRQVKEKGFLKYVDRSWNEFEKYVLNYKGDDYGDIYTFVIPNVWVKDAEKWIDIVDQFYKCSNVYCTLKHN